jgi:hypothetical protein
MDFGWALDELKERTLVRRFGWNGKGMYLFLVTPSEYTILGWEGMEHCPFIAMKTADEKVVPWLASQTDMLADDWERVINL